MKMTRRRLAATCVALIASIASALTLTAAAQQSPAVPGIHAKTFRRLLIRNATVIYGSGRPPFGPADIVVEDGRIAIVGLPGGQTARPPDAVIDATGKYVMPGIVNTHMHWHEERQPGIPQPIQYERNLYLAAGVTTAREVGGDFDKSKTWQAETAAHGIISPRIVVYPVVSKGRTGSPAEIRAWIRNVKDKGADGLKIIAVDRDQLEAILDEAPARITRIIDMMVEHHVGWSPTFSIYEAGRDVLRAQNRLRAEG